MVVGYLLPSRLKAYRLEFLGSHVSIVDIFIKIQTKICTNSIKDLCAKGFKFDGDIMKIEL